MGIVDHNRLDSLAHRTHRRELPHANEPGPAARAGSLLHRLVDGALASTEHLPGRRVLAQLRRRLWTAAAPTLTRVWGELVADVDGSIEIHAAHAPETLVLTVRAGDGAAAQTFTLVRGAHPKLARCY